MINLQSLDCELLERLFFSCTELAPHIYKNSENFKKNLEDFQKTKVSNDLQVAFAKLNDEYGIIQSKSNAEIKSLKICVIILFVALFAITVGIVGFAWKKMMPTNFYQKYNEEVSAS